MNILITSASRKVALIKAFQQALALEAEGEVLAVDASPLSAALYVAHRALLAPRGLGDTFFEFIREVCQRYEIRLLIPTRDEELPFFAARKAELATLGVTVMVAALEVIQLCQDKRRFIEFCIENDFAVAESFDRSAIAPSLPFPLFVRERYGKGSRAAFRIDTPETLAFVVSQLRDPIIQRFIDGVEYTVDLFADFDGNVVSVVPRQRLVTFGGESFVGKTVKNWDVIQASLRLARALKLVGHNTIQCFLHEDQVKFIEVNPRYGGGANLSFAAGACTPRYLVQLLLGQELAPRIGDFKEHLTMLRYTEDLFLGDDEVLSQGDRGD